MCVCPFKTLAGFTLYSSGLGWANTASVDKREMQKTQTTVARAAAPPQPSATRWPLLTQDSHAAATPTAACEQGMPTAAVSSPRHARRPHNCQACSSHTSHECAGDARPAQLSRGQQHRMPLPPAKTLHRTETGEGKQMQAAPGMASKCITAWGPAAEPAVPGTSRRPPSSPGSRPRPVTHVGRAMDLQGSPQPCPRPPADQSRAPQHGPREINI